MMKQKLNELVELAAQAEGETDCKDALDAISGLIFPDEIVYLNVDSKSDNNKWSACITSVDKLCMQRFIERMMAQDMRAYSVSSNIYTKADANIEILAPTDVEAVEHKHCENDNKAENSEKHLKKLIKYAKTPMERKMYEKKLNALYKKRKKNEKSDRAT